MRTVALVRWFMVPVFVAMVVGRLGAVAHADGIAGLGAVTAWNDITTRAVVDPVVAGQLGAGLPPGHALVVIGYVQAAVYNAVVAIEGGYQPYRSTLAPQPNASVEAAVAAATHRVLVHYLPAQQGLLDAHYTSAVAAIPDGVSKAAGLALGEAAAAELIAQRAGDGLGVQYPYPLNPDGPGHWVPPANGGLTPWLGQMKPFLISRHDQFRPGPPPAPHTGKYRQQYEEVLAIGRSDSTERTAAQTDASRFWTDNPARQNNRAFTAVINERGLNALEAARLYAMGNLVTADAAIACWDAKYHYQYWRPGPAIVGGDADSNPKTVGNPTWTPLIGTPPHPEYPSGHGCVTSALAEVFTTFLGTPHINVSITSSAANVSQTTRFFASANELRQEIIDVRVWSGIHFRNSDEVGADMGRKLAKWALNRYFNPIR